MERTESNKIIRVLDIYTKLLGGGIINKAEEAQNYGVNERSIQRDINDIRDFLDA
ncbi:MAG: WYL domain-containing protein, partial [Roseburia sp.]|nr:WYL domain-containing protein [Roseburia sp.]